MVVGLVAALAVTACADGAADQSASAPSPAATYRLGGPVAVDGFNRTGNTLGRAFVGGPWATASPTGSLRLENGAATWSAFVMRGQTTHAWLPEVSASDTQLNASFRFGLISRASPALSFMVIGYPIRLIVGLTILAALVPVIPGVTNSLVDSVLMTGAQLARAFR